MARKFYTLIHNSMGILLGWGFLNVLAGATGAIFSRDKFRRQFWLQCLGWGLVNALIAGFSQASYRKKLAKLPAGPDDETPEGSKPDAALKKDIRNIFLILLVNVFLDVGYVVAGGFIRRAGTVQNDRGKAGIGFAFMIQGVFLFLFDGILSFVIGRRWRRN